ncbi:S1C family serine protease [Cohnella suwonensis]|uniref:S1C family serine protease n=1 Tax=Cohnella suwonensis TaxID=696072 RepID=A0ABW0LWG8_9BACL
MKHDDMHEENAINDANEPVTVYVYDSSKRPEDLRSSYENELAASEPAEWTPSGDGNRGNEPKRPSFRTMTATFLIGAVFVGGMAFASDRYDLFGGFGASASVTASPAIEDSGLKTASVNAAGSSASVYEAANPAVVKIENYSAPSASGRNGTNFLFGGRGGGIGQGQGQTTSEPVLAGTGSGFFYSADGYILTNEHVIADASELKVTVQGYDQPLTAKVVGSSADLDLAVLKVESPDGKAFPKLTLGDSNEAKIGDWVIAIGNPYGFDHTMTMGVLSAKERPITISDEEGEHEYKHLLQTDASINSGNSGGPLLNDKGEVIGINTAVNAEAQGIGFAIPTSTIKEALGGLTGNGTQS